jgi:D-psicose/D-tagatose/L-ribulose 3-epimerase
MTYRELMTRLKIGVCNEMFQDWPIEEVLAYAAELGCDGVEIAPYSLAETLDALSAERRRAIRQAAERAGVEIVGLHWLLVKPEGLSINCPDAAVRARTAEYLRALIRLCADLGGRVLIHGSPGQRTVQDGWSAEDSWRRARETFESCLPALEQCGATYCIEPLSRNQTNFVNTVADAVRLVREIGHPGFQLMVDCRSAEAGGSSAAAELDAAIASGHLRHVHVNDANGRGPGFGRVRFGPILQRLLGSDYQGYVSVEVFEFDPDPRTIAARSVGYLKGILEALTPAIS